VKGRASGKRARPVTGQPTFPMTRRVPAAAAGGGLRPNRHTEQGDVHNSVAGLREQQ